MREIAKFDPWEKSQSDDERTRLRVQPRAVYKFSHGARGKLRELVVAEGFRILKVFAGGWDAKEREPDWGGSDRVIAFTSSDGRTASLEPAILPPNGYIVVEVQNETDQPQRLVATLSGD